jgi:hypothetical protein
MKRISDSFPQDLNKKKNSLPLAAEATEQDYLNFQKFRSVEPDCSTGLNSNCCCWCLQKSKSNVKSEISVDVIIMFEASE